MAKSKGEAEDKDGKEAAEGGKKKKMMIIGVVVVALAVGGYMFLGQSSSKPTTGPKKPSPGPVATLDPITVNLAGGHFLKIGLALQEKAGGPAELDGAEALDLTISLFSGKTLAELSEAKGREAAKAKLIAAVTKAYENKVYDIYFTEFVMQ